MEKLILNASKRDILGSKVKKIRENGNIPGIVYGKDFKNINLEFNKNEFLKIFDIAGTSTLVELNINGDKYNVLIREPQINPVSDEFIHIDLYKVDMNKEIHTEIPLEFIGTSLAVDDLEGNLITNKDALEVECLPDKLVSEIKVDISNLKTFEDLIKVADLNIPEGIKVLDESEEIIAQVTPPRSEEELEEMEQEAAADSEKAQIENIEAEAEKEKAEKAEVAAEENASVETETSEQNTADQK